MGFSQNVHSWEPAMLRGVSRGEAAHLEESGRAFIENLPFTVAGQSRTKPEPNHLSAKELTIGLLHSKDQ